MRFKSIHGCFKTKDNSKTEDFVSKASRHEQHSQRHIAFNCIRLILIYSSTQTVIKVVREIFNMLVARHKSVTLN